MTISTSAFEALAFRLGREEYGVDILKVQEIRGHDPVTRIANAPDYIRGVINLRGLIVPVVDLRRRFQIEIPDDDQFSVVIVLNIGARVIGMVVDGVSDVIGLAADDIRPAPQMGAALDAHFLLGIGAVEDRMLLLLDIEGLMSSAELGLIARSQPEHLAA
jgi:purine-binding chemotaxis protein CheW